MRKKQFLKHTLGAGDLERLRAGLLRGGVLRLCLSLGGDARRLGGERGNRPRGDIGLQALLFSALVMPVNMSVLAESSESMQRPCKVQTTLHIGNSKQDICNACCP